MTDHTSKLMRFSPKQTPEAPHTTTQRPRLVWPPLEDPFEDEADDWGDPDEDDWAHPA